MITKVITDFDLNQISRSGQCFRMCQLSEDTYSLIAYGKYLEVRQQDTQVTFSCSEEEYETLWRRYFDLDLDYGKIKKAVDPEDAYLLEAVQIGGGIHILQQELWETIVTFILSQQNNIPRIKKCVSTLCREFGEKACDFRGNVYDLFPKPQALAQVSEDVLRGLGLGYRASYIKKTAQAVCDGRIDLENLFSMNYEEAHTELMKLCGVGKKVADCVCLFALHHIEAFPVDTHIQDMLDRYPKGFPFVRYQGFAGILQQYAFYYELFGTKELCNI